MSELTEPLNSEDTESLQALSHLRMLILMGCISVLGSIVGFIFVSGKFGLGFILGGILSFINYYWLKHSLKVVFDQVEQDIPPTFSGTRYILRYFIFGLVLLMIYLTHLVSVPAVILGLGSFAFAIVIEGIIRLFTSFKR